MFYAHIVLAKKGPLARIWLAAHWDKKLTKAHVFETDIQQSVEGIMQPKMKLALRTSGHLLLGVVRIYSRKAKYLLADCNEAFVKIKMAFRPGMVDLPVDHLDVNTITLPEVFHDFDTGLPELNDNDIEAQLSINQSRAEDITMPEDYSNLPMSIHDDGFGDMGFDSSGVDLIQKGVDETLMNEELDQVEMDDNSKEPLPGTSRTMLEDMESQQLMDDEHGFGDEPAAGLFEGDLFGDPLDKTDLGPADESDDDFGGAPSVASSFQDSRPPSAMDGPDDALGDISPAIISSPAPHEEIQNAGDVNEAIGETIPPPAPEAIETQPEEESFELAPVDTSALRGLPKAKRKRKLIVDEIKNISGDEMKSQLANTSDIITTLDLAPPTKRLMYWKETGGVEKLFALPSHDIPARGLFKNFQRNLTSRSGAIEDFSVLGPEDVLALEQYQEQPAQAPAAPEPTPARGLRKRKAPPTPHSTLRNNAAEIESLNDALMPPPQEKFATPLIVSAIEREDVLPSSELAPVGADYMVSLDGADIMTPRHAIEHMEHMENFPQLPADQVSSILDQAGMEPFGGMDYSEPPPSERIASDWADDYDFPPSVGPAQPGDEQMENETDEQFEERVLNKRAAQMFKSVKSRFDSQDSLYLSTMTIRNNRKQAAQKFYSLLVLKKFQALEIKQDDAYGDILITRGVNFDNPTL